MTLTRIKPQSLFNDYTPTPTPTTDIVIYSSLRQTPSNENPCYGFLKDGECNSGECGDCVEFVARIPYHILPGLLENLKLKFNTARYTIESMLGVVSAQPFYVELFVRDELYDKAILLYKKFTKLELYSFMMAQNRRAKQLAANDPVPEISTATVLPSEVNKKIAAYMGLFI